MNSHQMLCPQNSPLLAKVSVVDSHSIHRFSREWTYITLIFLYQSIVFFCMHPAKVAYDIYTSLQVIFGYAQGAYYAGENKYPGGYVSFYSRLMEYTFMVTLLWLHFYVLHFTYYTFVVTF